MGKRSLSAFCLLVVPIVVVLAVLVIVLLNVLPKGGGQVSLEDWTKKYGVLSVNLDGSDLKLIYQSDMQINHLHVSPDGKKILFSEFTKDLNKDGTANEDDIYSSEVGVMNIDGTGRKLLTGPDEIIDAVPVWSPNGKKILFASSRNSSKGTLNLDLYVMDIKGKNVKRLTKTNTTIEADPHWVGDTIAFTRLVPGENQQALWLMESDGSKARQLTTPEFKKKSKAPFTFGDFDPKISPNGEKVASYRHLDDGLKVGGHTIGNYDLFVINNDGTGKKMLTDTPEVAEAMPTWAPDGSMLAFWIIKSDEMGLRVINPDGSGEREVLKDWVQNAGAAMPSWFPEGERLIFSASKF